MNQSSTPLITHPSQPSLFTSGYLSPNGSKSPSVRSYSRSVNSHSSPSYAITPIKSQSRIAGGAPVGGAGGGLARAGPGMGARGDWAGSGAPAKPGSAPAPTSPSQRLPSMKVSVSLSLSPSAKVSSDGRAGTAPSGSESWEEMGEVGGGIDGSGGGGGGGPEVAMGMSKDLRLKKKNSFGDRKGSFGEDGEDVDAGDDVTLRSWGENSYELAEQVSCLD